MLPQNFVINIYFIMLLSVVFFYFLDYKISVDRKCLLSAFCLSLATSRQ